jgi:hypothetical protein
MGTSPLFPRLGTHLSASLHHGGAGVGGE